VKPLLVDVDGVLWTGGGGLASFDGTIWTILSTSNSDLPHNTVNSMVIDGNGIKWIGTNGGLASLNGENWTIYDNSNSELPHNTVNSVAVEEGGIVWIGTDDGLATFDNGNWTNYNTSNSDLPDNDVNTILIDQSGIKWIGTNGGGLVRFDGENWIVYTSSNSSVPGNTIVSIVIEDNGNRWIGTTNGIAFYSPGGIVSAGDYLNPGSQIPDRFFLSQNYPNPFNPVTNFEFRIADFGFVVLKIYDVLGKVVATLVNEEKNPGIYKINFNAAGLSSGVYFYKLQAGSFVQTKKMILMK
jgi:ligand-binding sensor domain-containing protein